MVFRSTFEITISNAELNCKHSSVVNCLNALSRTRFVSTINENRVVAQPWPYRARQIGVVGKDRASGLESPHLLSIVPSIEKLPLSR